MSKKSEAFIDLPTISKFDEAELERELNSRVDEAISNGETLKNVDIFIGKGVQFQGIVRCFKDISRIGGIIEREQKENPELILGTVKIKTKASEFLCLAEKV